MAGCLKGAAGLFAVWLARKRELLSLALSRTERRDPACGVDSRRMEPKSTRNVFASLHPDTAPTVGAKTGSPHFGKRSQGNAFSCGIAIFRARDWKKPAPSKGGGRPV